jgi:methyltransferase (TIGR00027 family)
MDPVSVTALWTAAERARESARPDRLFHDPWAKALGGSEGEQALLAMEAASPQSVGNSAAIAIRSRFIDDALLTLLRNGEISQVVIVAAGMDARAIRLELSPDLVLFELDQPDLLALKQARLEAIGASSRCKRVSVGADVTQQWPDQLTRAGFVPGKPVIWLAEGLFVYLIESDVHRLLDTMGKLSVPGSWIIADVVGRSLLESPWFIGWLDALRAKGVPWRFGTDDPETLLSEHGWHADVTRYGEEGANFGRWPFPVAPRNSPGFPNTYLVLGQRLG